MELRQGCRHLEPAEQKTDEALHGAVNNGHPKCAELLLQVPGIKINKVDKEGGRTPLAGAANRGELERLTLLLQADGIAVNKVDTPHSPTPPT